MRFSISHIINIVCVHNKGLLMNVLCAHTAIDFLPYGIVPHKKPENATAGFICVFRFS